VGDHLTPGLVVEVAPGVRRVIAPNPGIMTGPGTNTYLLGEDRVALIDPGPDDDSHLKVLLEIAADRLRWILVTHTHLDHSPLAARLRQATGAEVVGFGPAPDFPAARGFEGHDRQFAPDRLLFDRDRIDAGDLAIEVVYSPGHTSNHLCFELAGTGLLFSGDHVMSGSTVVIAPPDGDMTIYMASLEKVRARPLRRIGPGHGDMIDDPGAVLDEYLRHRRAREEQVLAELRRAGDRRATTADLVENIYRDVPRELHPVARLTVWAHLRKLGDEGLASATDADDPEAAWVASRRIGS
jgi:glyoxylase-like metal-dependent hydrolase (beta-lactamase superfamily II)